MHDYSPTALLADPASERGGVSEFLRGYGVDATPEHLATPLARLQAFLARPAGNGPSRFSDGTFPAVYMGDAEATSLAEVSHHLAARMAETDAEKTRTHYFLLARFTLAGATLDVRKGFPRLHRAEDWGPSQAFGAQAWSRDAAGITFNSVRRPGAQNVAVLKADLVQAGARLKIVGLRWDGSGLASL